ncbi:unnamed protein product [Parnassius apollo]|uniref:(apollo) hypothetical protein n=1 Tax=Parnassius apollo TaxID=110799 RepID=A0A8S3XEY8_PARAO|nr:unnamed protein product [Parnassius apollo]
MQNEQYELNETNNSVLFVNNQFPNPYDALVGHDSVASNSASSTFFDNGYIDYMENEKHIYNPESFDSKNFDNQTCSNTQTYEIVKNVAIEDIFPLETEQLSPSSHSVQVLSLRLTPSLIYNSENASNSFEPSQSYLSTSNDKSDDDLTVPLIQEKLTAHETIPPNLPTYLTPTACPELINKLVDYSDTDSESEEPVIKRKKRCQVKKEEWTSEINKKNREKGKEYCGKKKVDGEWKKKYKETKKGVETPVQL